jgi:hypothetical protein
VVSLLAVRHICRLTGAVVESLDGFDDLGLGALAKAFI